MIKQFCHFLIFLPLTLLACGRAGVDAPTDATNEDAIYNIIRYDSPSAFDLDLFDLSVPDTSISMGAAYQPVYWWRTIGHDSLDIDIRIFNPGPNDTLGAVPYANVTVVKYFWGSLEVIAVDTTGDSNRRVRFTKPFAMEGVISSVFEKYGFDYNTRRGWRLAMLSDAIFIPQAPGTPAAPPRIEVQTPDSLIRINTAVKVLRNLPQFTPGESVTVNTYPVDTISVIQIRYPSGNSLASREVPRTTGGLYSASFTFPRHEEFGHFLVDVINGSALTDSLGRYIPNAIGVIYRAR